MLTYLSSVHCNYADVATLAARLPRLVWNYRLPEPAYTHLDFLWGQHNPELLHSQILSLMQKY